MWATRGSAMRRAFRLRCLKRGCEDLHYAGGLRFAQDDTPKNIRHSKYARIPTGAGSDAGGLGGIFLGWLGFGGEAVPHFYYLGAEFGG